MISRYLDIQCRHSIPALIVWAARAKYNTARPIATQFPGHGCMDDLTTERSLVLQALRVSFMCLAYCFYMFFMGVLQPGSGGRGPVDCRMN